MSFEYPQHTLCIRNKKIIVTIIRHQSMLVLGIGPKDHYQGSHRLEKYLNIQDCLEKSLKIKFALKST